MHWLVAGAALAAIAYVLLALLAVRRFGCGLAHAANHGNVPVTILKPLCGLEPGLYENLLSFCVQDHPCYQVVFGVRDPGDPAIEIARRVIDALPDQDLTLVIEPRIAGSNLKVSNLIHMRAAAKHSILLIADADMRVTPDYLATVTAPFADPAVGAVTCLYKGTPAAGFASTLGALFINEWFLPSVLIALSFEKLRYCFGATMAVRNAILTKIGGFESLADELADDHLLGSRVDEAGLRVVLAPYLVENVVYEAGPRALFLHELRWARTIKAVRPGGYAFSFVTYAVPLSLLFAATTGSVPAGATMVLAACTARLLLHREIAHSLGVPRFAHAGWIPLRDVMSFVVWAASFWGRRIHWKDQRFNLKHDGQLVNEGSQSP
jgi:ceramide glucosyltransferase